VRAVAVDEIEVRAADPLDGRDVQLHGPDRALHRLRAALHRQLERLGRVADPESHGVGRRAVGLAESRGLALRLHVEDEVDVALAEAEHVLGPVLRHRREAHLLEQALEPLRLGRGELHEFEAIGAERVLEEVAALGRGLDVHLRASCRRISIICNQFAEARRQVA